MIETLSFELSTMFQHLLLYRRLCTSSATRGYSYHFKFKYADDYIENMENSNRKSEENSIAH